MTREKRQRTDVTLDLELRGEMLWNGVLKTRLNNKTVCCFAAAHLHYSGPQPQLLTGERCEPSTLRKNVLTALLNEMEGMTRRGKATNCAGPSVCVHTVKSTAGFYFGCFYHFGLLTWAPLKAINSKPQSLLPVPGLTFLPPLKEERVEERKKEKAKSNLLFLYEIYSPGVLVNNDLIYQWLPCYLHCFRCVFSACDWAKLFSRVERGGWGPGRLTSVWSKFMWNFPGPPGSRCLWTVIKRVILTVWPRCTGEWGRRWGGRGCRRDGWREEFGYVSVCKEEVLSQVLMKQRKRR